MKKAPPMHRRRPFKGDACGIPYGYPELRAVSSPPSTSTDQNVKMAFALQKRPRGLCVP
jgi:hypothetical protein